MSNESSWLNKCPVCRSGSLHQHSEKRLFGLRESKGFRCSQCGAFFAPVGDRYQLVSVDDTSYPIWQEYKHQTLTTREWRSIASGGMSDARQREADMEVWLTHMREHTPALTQDEPPVILKRGEELKAVLPNITLLEPRKITTGGYGGPSIRVAKGMYIRLGGFRAQSHEEVKEIDKGVLTLTSRRLIFSGSKRAYEISLRKILSVEPYSDGIAIRRSGKQKTEYFVGTDKVMLDIQVGERRYREPLSGIVLKLLIEGLASRLE